jgi:dTDP-4-dehydrorhamnose 3,5-epimerase
VIVSAPAALPDLLVIEPKVYRDTRGMLLELHNLERYAAAGVAAAFVQDNLSHSRQHVLRGLHLQHPRAQGKLVTVVRGEVFDVAVDVRVGSPTFGRWAGFVLSADNAHQLWIPPGFAHGFTVTGDEALVLYKCTEPYVPGGERSIRWNDPAIGIDWPVASPVLSEKDAAAPTLDMLGADALPRWRARDE